ncbi:xylulokinase [Agromyces aerolatus]|uniref:xylulokinase n=1 Tax=Agromyces sp. LY-1074 TaxID=3074080 RepID=UPI0028617575|nr:MULTISPECIES: FGGY family carbohydrate kinase [unclassified Agromyces]MDR5700200.1 FGGY family carbohydrate kinase [Agromyces sp. LY-1074]MDR5706432.1 FGGY family carbohydrate kinase [Agromyces sp. LY-1358]
MTDASAPVLIGIDVGTTGVKVIGLDPRSGVVAAAAAREYPSTTAADGTHEQDPAAWWEAVAACTRAVVDALPGRPVAGVGLSGHMHSLLLVDADGEAVLPAMTWADRRSAAETTRLAGDPRFRETAGNDVVGAFTAPKLAWAARTHPDAVSRASRLVLTKDLIGHRLTGAWATDETDALGTLLYDFRAQRWSPELFQATGASPELGQPVLASTAIRGVVHEAAATATGLPAGTPVVAGAGDVSASVVGAGVVDRSRMVLNVGTAAQVMGVSPIPDPGPGFLFGSATGEGFVTMASLYAAGASVRWAERTVLGGADINEAASTAEAGSAGLTYLPFMFGSTVPRKNDAVRAAFLGQTEQHGTAELAGAVLEGIAFACADAIDAVAEVTGRPDVVHLVGGVTRSERWRQALASVVDARLELVPDGGSALGAAVLAGLGTGVYASAADAANAIATVPVPLPDERDVHRSRHARDRYREWCERLL